MIITDAGRNGQIATVLTVIATLIVVALFRFGHNLHAAVRAHDEDDARDEDDLRTLARVAHSIDGMDEQKLHELEQWVG